MKIKLLGQVDHNGKRYDAGAVLEMDDDQAQALLVAGAAEPASEKAKPKSEAA